MNTTCTTFKFCGNENPCWMHNVLFYMMLLYIYTLWKMYFVFQNETKHTPLIRTHDHSLISVSCCCFFFKTASYFKHVCVCIFEIREFQSFTFNILTFPQWHEEHLHFHRTNYTTLHLIFSLAVSLILIKLLSILYSIF